MKYIKKLMDISFKENKWHIWDVGRWGAITISLEKRVILLNMYSLPNNVI